jgi:hypothetical protein
MIGTVAEYLIRTAEAHDLPLFDRERNAAVLTPARFACTPIEGWGDFRTRCGDAEVAYSGEDAGWQVIIEGSLPDPDRFIAQVTAQVADAVGESCEWLRLD